MQNVDYEARLLARLYQKYYQREAFILREDFCGSFALCATWIRQDKSTNKRQALGVDIDKKVLDWGHKHHLQKLQKEQKKRLIICQQDVRNVKKPTADICVALNFSYWIFLKRDELLQYFRHIKRSLQKKNGLFVVDSFGGSEAEVEKKEYRHLGKFTFIWEQRKFYPGTREIDCRIHFRLRSGKLLKNAFRYHWRLWTPPEISEILLAAGFSHVDWYYESTELKTGQGNGQFRLSKNGRGQNAETWLGYAAALT